MSSVSSMLRIFLLILFTSKITQCLKCLQCVSFQNLSCKDGSASSYECPFSNQTYCITYSGRLPGSSPVLIRGCSVVNLTEECHENVPVSSGKSGEKPMEIIMCYTTCRSDSCNTDTHDFLSNGVGSLRTFGVPYFWTFLVTIFFSLPLRLHLLINL